MIKGIEALTFECFLAAARAGVVEEVAASLKNNFPGLDWKKIVPYNLERMARHGERRAAEMEEVVAMLPELGVEPLMAAATVKRQREMGRIGKAGFGAQYAGEGRRRPSSTRSAPPRATGINRSVAPRAKTSGSGAVKSPVALDRLGQKRKRRLRRALLASRNRHG